MSSSFFSVTTNTSKLIFLFKQAFWFLAILVGLPFPIMLLVNVDRGRTEGAALAKTLAQLAHVSDALDDLDAQDTLSEEIRNDLRGSFSYQRGGRQDL